MSKVYLPVWGVNFHDMEAEDREPRNEVARKNLMLARSRLNFDQMLTTFEFC